MFEDDFFSKYSSTTTTENETDTMTNTTYSPQTDFLSQSLPFDEDYSLNQNFTEQTTYQGVSRNNFEEEIVKTFETPSLNAPLIEKEEKAVTLTKKRAKLIFETRMKIVMSVFCVIVACLLFVTVFNFIEAGRIESKFASKQLEINSLEQSITDSKATYTLISNEEYLKQWAESNDFVLADETNTIVVNMSEFYEEPAGPEKLSSNWFNDVCEFLSRLFA